MPTSGDRPIDDVFGVIAHPVRRELLERLAAGLRPVRGLAGRSAVSQQLRLMPSLGVIAERRDGRKRLNRLERECLGDVEGWLERIRLDLGPVARPPRCPPGREPINDDQKADSA